jgi:hypothetical protein
MILRRTLLLAMLTLAMLLPIGCLPSANAVNDGVLDPPDPVIATDAGPEPVINARPVTIAGCADPATLKASPWGKNITVPSYPPGIMDLNATLRLGAYVKYWRCPATATKPVKALVVSMRFCVTKMDKNPAQPLRGLDFDPFYFDENEEVDPLTKVWNFPNGLHGEAGTQKCAVQTVPNGQQKWFEFPQEPGWSLEGKTRLEGYKDRYWFFGTDTADVKHLRGADDPDAS